MLKTWNQKVTDGCKGEVLVVLKPLVITFVSFLKVHFLLKMISKIKKRTFESDKRVKKVKVK